MSAKPEKKKIAWSLWVPVVLAFLLIIAAWTVLIKVAKENPVEQIEIKSDGSDGSDGSD